MLAADTMRIWFAAHADDSRIVRHDLPLTGDEPPTKSRVLRNPLGPLPLLDDGERLWLPAHETAGGFVDVFMLPHARGTPEAVPEARADTGCPAAARPAGNAIQPGAAVCRHQPRVSRKPRERCA